MKNSVEPERRKLVRLASAHAVESGLLRHA
jgi:hypothetical protein